jgi:hypothetical protein
VHFVWPFRMDVNDLQLQLCGQTLSILQTRRDDDTKYSSAVLQYSLSHCTRVNSWTTAPPTPVAPTSVYATFNVMGLPLDVHTQCTNKTSGGLIQGAIITQYAGGHYYHLDFYRQMHQLTQRTHAMFLRSTWANPGHRSTLVHMPPARIELTCYTTMSSSPVQTLAQYA